MGASCRTDGNAAELHGSSEVDPVVTPGVIVRQPSLATTGCQTLCGVDAASKCITVV